MPNRNTHALVDPQKAVPAPKDVSRWQGGGTGGDDSGSSGSSGSSGGGGSQV